MFYWCIDIKIIPDLWYDKITSSNKYKRRGSNLMIYQMNQNEQIQNRFSDIAKEFQIENLPQEIQYFQTLWIFYL